MKCFGVRDDGEVEHARRAELGYGRPVHVHACTVLHRVQEEGYEFGERWPFLFDEPRLPENDKGVLQRFESTRSIQTEVCVCILFVTSHKHADTFTFRFFYVLLGGLF